MAGAGRVRSERERVVRVGGVLSRPRARASRLFPSLLHTHLPQRGLRAVQLDGGLDHVQHGRKGRDLHHLCGGSGWGEVGEGAAMAAGGAGERKSAREVEVRFFFSLLPPSDRAALPRCAPAARPRPFFSTSTPPFLHPQAGAACATYPHVDDFTDHGGRDRAGRLERRARKRREGGEWLQQRASEQRGPRAPGRPPSFFFRCSSARHPPI